MSVNNVKNTNKQDLIFSSGAALGGGVLAAYGGASSEQLFQNRWPSDTFIKSVKDKVVETLDEKTVEKINSFGNYINRVKKAKSMDDLVLVDIKFRLKQSPDITFDNLKQEIIEEEFKKAGEYALLGQDAKAGMIVDLCCDIRDSRNIYELQEVLVPYREMQFKDLSIEQLKNKKIAEVAETLGFEYESFESYSAEAIKKSYNFEKGKFIFDNKKITKDLFDIVNNSAKDIKNKAAGLYGFLGAVIVGGGTYLITKLVPKNKTYENVNSLNKSKSIN